MLKQLAEYSRRKGGPENPEDEVPPEYEKKPVRWQVFLDQEGRLVGFLPTSGGGKRDLGKAIAFPFLKRSGTALKPQLLTDFPEFVFGVPAGDASRAARRREEFRELVRACAEWTDLGPVRAVANFLASAEGTELPHDLGARDLVTFVVDGRLVTNSPEVQAFWADVAPLLRERGLPPLTAGFVLDSLKQRGRSEASAGCAVCLETRPVARIHPVPIRFPRPVADQQLALVSADDGSTAFHSRGMTQGYVAPTCLSCARDYARGLNKLAADDSTSRIVGSSVAVAWTRNEVGFPGLNLLSAPTSEDAAAWLDAAATGKLPASVVDTEFYSAVFSASGSRVVVRAWVDAHLKEIVPNLLRWFSLHAINDWDGGPARRLGIFSLCRPMLPLRRGQPDWQALSSSVLGSFWRAALQGEPIPLYALTATTARIRPNRPVRTEQAALIKAVLLSNDPTPHEEDHMVGLEPEHPDPAYHCGRLLAVLERIHERAIPNVGNTVADRFFGTASAAPGAVFGTLVRGARPHLAVLEGEPSTRGLAAMLERDLGEVLEQIGGSFPHVLTSTQRGLFVLGFYHQKTHRPDRVTRPVQDLEEASNE